MSDILIYYGQQLNYFIIKGPSLMLIVW